MVLNAFCPSPRTLRRSLDLGDPMPESERRRIERHVGECRLGCKEAMDSLVRADSMWGEAAGTTRDVLASPDFPAMESDDGAAAYDVFSPTGEALPRTFGRYRIEKLLGRGGMGDVYLALDEPLDRRVALKIPRFGASSLREGERRFLREARAAATLAHPGICPVHDVGRIEGISYLAMAYVEGESLAGILIGGAQPIRDSVAWTHGMAMAMQEAHQRGVVHRDLKPGNVIIDRRGQPVIMDFGLARRGPESGDVRLTRSSMILGTPAYMSPEQTEGALAVGPAGDIYALGVILYELLTGRLPFTGTLLRLISQIVSAPPPRPSQFRPGLAPELEAICLTALRKRPDERFPSMQAFADALEAVSEGPAPRPAPSLPRSGPAAESVARKAEPSARDELRRLCLAARYSLERRTEETHRRSIEIYTQILDRDPAYCEAWAGLASAYHLLSLRSLASPLVACPKARGAALRALALDPSQVEAQRVLGAILTEYDWDLSGAEAVLRRALERSPGDATTHQLHGKSLACLGRHDEAIAALRRAVDLDPASAILSTLLGRQGYLLARRYGEAVLQFQKTLEFDPTFWLAHRYLGWALILQGRTAEALAEFQTARRLYDNPVSLADLAYAYCASGEPGRAVELRDRVEILARQGYVSAESQVLAALGLGDKDDAFQWLDRACEERSEWMCKIRVDPVLDPLRSDPRFEALTHRVFPSPVVSEGLP